MGNATSKVGSLHAQSHGARLVWIALFLSAASVLAISRVLTPSASGIGTHTQLGLPACGFLFLTGLPCPGCGLTTSFAHLARFQLGAAIAATPLGVPLFLLTVLAVPLSLAGAVLAWPPFDTLKRLHADRVVYVLAAAAGLSWVSQLLRIWLAA